MFAALAIFLSLFHTASDTNKKVKVQPTFAVSWVLLVLEVFRKCVHDVELFQRQNPETFDEPSQTERGPTTLAVIIRVEQERNKTTDEFARVGLNRWDEWRQAVSNGFLDLVST